MAAPRPGAATTTGTATEGFFTAIDHLTDSVSKQVARRLMNTVDPREVAWVVIGHRTVFTWRSQFAFVDQLLQKLGVMSHLKRITELRIIVRQRVQAVRTLGENLSGVMFLKCCVRFPDSLNILLHKSHLNFLIP